MFYGIIEDPESKYQLGQPVWSNKVYTDYMDWKNGKEYWKLMEAAFMEKLVNGATPEMMLGKAGLQPLLDGKVAEEDMFAFEVDAVCVAETAVFPVVKECGKT